MCLDLLFNSSERVGVNVFRYCKDINKQLTSIRFAENL